MAKQKSKKTVSKNAERSEVPKATKSNVYDVIEFSKLERLWNDLEDMERNAKLNPLMDGRTLVDNASQFVKVTRPLEDAIKLAWLWSGEFNWIFLDDAHVCEGSSQNSAALKPWWAW